MTPSLVVDLLLILAVLISAWSGWRHGGISTFLAAIGVVAGLVCTAGLVPLAMGLTESVPLRFLAAVGVVTLLLILGNLVGSILGARLRDQLRTKGALLLDSAIGAAIQVVVTLAVILLISIPLATGLKGEAATGIQGSRILGALNKVVPDSVHQLPAEISAMLNESGLPPLLTPYDDAQLTEVAAPNIEVADTELVEEMRPSVIHVIGTASQCSRQLLGSGFVIAEDYVVTNAHVVAGTEAVELDTTAGMRDADVVYYNPQLDIALLHASDLSLPALAWADEEAETAEDAIVMGFPESGPFEAAPARVSGKLTISGPNIYSSGRVEREAYTVRGTIREGNSGGPMTNTDGEVLGVVFGASVDSSDIGYVLTAQEVEDALGDVTRFTLPVDTQECVAR